MVSPVTGNPFLGLAQGAKVTQGFIDAFRAPQLQQLQLLQEQAKLEQMRGLDTFSQSQMAAQEAKTRQGQQRLDLAERVQDQDVMRYRNELVMGMSKAVLPLLEAGDTESAEKMFAAIESITGKALAPEVKTLEAQKGIVESFSSGESRKPFQAVEGEGMEGWVFDPNTGKFSISPDVKSYLSQRPEKKEELKMSDIRDINNDITRLTQNAVGVREGAKSLIDIGDNPSPAQAVAAIFKFMKSLDPTSVVRQEEQGLVAQASGPMEAFAGYINRMMGDGPITREVMRDIIKTAAGLANSAISETDSVVKSHISVFPELSVDRRKSMLSRIPGRINTPDFSDVMENAGPDLPPMSDIGGLDSQIEALEREIQELEGR